MRSLDRRVHHFDGNESGHIDTETRSVQQPEIICYSDAIGGSAQCYARPAQPSVEGITRVQTLRRWVSIHIRAPIGWLYHIDHVEIARNLPW